jgi:hypothetical protein
VLWADEFIAIKTITGGPVCVSVNPARCASSGNLFESCVLWAVLSEQASSREVILKLRCGSVDFHPPSIGS